MASSTIGEAARAANVNVETIRFYERRGLIEQPVKPSHGGFRKYDREAIARICFVRQAQKIGFSLSEIAELLALRTDPAADCGAVRIRAIGKREEVEGKIQQLTDIRDALDVLIASCPGGGDIEACTIIDAMEHGTRVRTIAVHQPEINQQEKALPMKTTEFSVDGMHCDGCAHTIEALLARVPGVRKAEVSFSEKRARVLHDPNASSDADLAAAIGKGGFTAKPSQE